MQCSACHHENQPAARFCASCGARLARTCPSCGKETAPAARFCASCGTALERANGPTSRPPSVERSPPSGERRQLTVLFCDVVGSTARAARLDPEEWRAVVVDYHRVAREMIARFDGHVAKYLGDGVLVYFGYPQAHEDDAAQAVEWIGSITFDVVRTSRRASAHGIGSAAALTWLNTGGRLISTKRSLHIKKCHDRREGFVVTTDRLLVRSSARGWQPPAAAGLYCRSGPGRGPWGRT